MFFVVVAETGSNSTLPRFTVQVSHAVHLLHATYQGEPGNASQTQFPPPLSSKTWYAHQRWLWSRIQSCSMMHSQHKGMHQQHVSPYRRKAEEHYMYHTIFSANTQSQAISLTPHKSFPHPVQTSIQDSSSNKLAKITLPWIKTTWASQRIFLYRIPRRLKQSKCVATYHFKIPKKTLPFQP